jgi:hypothetical protein
MVTICTIIYRNIEKKCSLSTERFYVFDMILTMSNINRLLCVMETLYFL